MARLTGPNERLVYKLIGRNLQGAPNEIATIFSDSGGTIPADILDAGGAAVPGAQLTLDQYSRLPLFQLPDGLDTVYAQVADGPVTPVYARVDDRLDALSIGGQINVTDQAYGAAIDGRRLYGAVTSSSSPVVTCSGATFTSADVGKNAVIITDSAGGTATTIASVDSPTQITLAANAGITTSAGYLIYGTDDSAAIQAALNAAAALTTSANTSNPNQPIGSGHALVVIPGDAPESLAIITSQLTVPTGAALRAHATLANLMPSRNAACVDVRPFAIVERLELECAFGTGATFGTNGAQAHIVAGELRVWHCKGSTTAPANLAGSTSPTGGTLSANTRYYVVTAIDAQGGETLVSNEVSITSTGSTSSNSLTWDAYAGAASYRIYRGTASGAQNLYFTSATNSFTDIGGASSSDYPIGPGYAAIFRGYHYELGMLWCKVARLGAYHRAGSDCVVNRAYMVGCTTGVRFNASNQVRYPALLLDTCGGSGSLGGIVLDNGCSNIDIDFQAFQIAGSGTTLSPVVATGPLTSTAKQTGCRVRGLAICTGGTLLSLANSQDCDFDLVGWNTATASSTSTAISTGVAYGSGLAGTIRADVLLSPSVTNARTGTVYPGATITAGSESASAAAAGAGAAQLVGSVTTTAGGSPSAGAVATVAFGGGGLAAEPRCIAITPTSADAAACGLYVSAKSKTSFTVSSSVAADPAATVDFAYTVTP